MNRAVRRLRLRATGLAFQSAGLASYLLVPHHKANVNPDVVLETWDAVADGAHNSNTDLIHWSGAFYLAHQTSPYHMGSRRSRLLLWRSNDARSWEKVQEFRNPEGEYRDPKFAAIGDQLMLYVLPNVSFMAEPVTTELATSTDGTTWSEFQEMEPKGWLFWRPKTRDSETWYVTAYWHEHGRSILLKSPDGVKWEVVSQIYEGERNDETDFEFLPDGRIIATGRLEVSGGAFGDRKASTFIATARPPYEEWNHVKTRLTRLDGPCLFSYNGRAYSIGRFQASFAPGLVEQGGLFSRKRTSVFLVEANGLTHLTDLPSAGDTSYAGISIRSNEAYVSYYSSPLDHDHPWFLGMLRQSDIRMARISLPALEQLAEEKTVK
jgi:hypothetical protein